MNDLTRLAIAGKLKLKAPLPIEQLREFEASMDVRLPSDYVSFVTEVANGGHHPCRLIPLEDWSGSYWIEEDESAHWLQSPCMVTPEAESHGSLWLEKVVGEDWEEKMDRGEFDPVYGSIAIAEIGCGLFFSLVVNGPHAGRVFSYGDHLLNPPRFVEEPDFISWITNCFRIASRREPIHFLNGLIPEHPSEFFWSKYY